LPGKYNTVIELCEKYISPTKYRIDNKIGGDGWEISPNINFGNGFRANLKVDDEAMATFIMMKLK
jgi:hypothetical protein